jgi:N-acetylglucosamine repressor
MASPANSKAVRVLNRQAVLNLLREHGPTTRPHLADLTGLSAMAISRQIQALIDEGLVREREQAESTGGRRPSLLEIDPGGLVVAGVKLTPSEIQGVLIDSHGAILGSASQPLHAGDRPGATLAEAHELVRRMAAAYRPDQRVAGIGIGLPGIIDWRAGVCVSAPSLGWENVDVASILAQDSGMEITVDNDVNSFAVAENLFGVGRQERNFAVVTLGRGIGGALILDGSLYRGSMGGAGEVGHSNVEPQGVLCECGNRGCLEAYLSDANLLDRIRAEGIQRPSVQDLADPAARARDPRLGECYADASRRLGMGVSHIINVLNPALIVLGGESALATPAFATDVELEAKRFVFPGLRDSFQIKTSQWVRDPSLWARGAASLVMEQHYSGLAL